MPPEIRPITFKLKRDSLDIPSNYTTKAHKTDFIIWSLKFKSGIDSFRIKIKPEDSVLFKTPPYQVGAMWIAEINHDVDSADCKYEILYWKARSSTMHTLDPIISIKPSILILNGGMSFFIVFIFLGAAGLWGKSFYRKWTSKRSGTSI